MRIAALDTQVPGSIPGDADIFGSLQSFFISMPLWTMVVSTLAWGSGFDPVNSDLFLDPQFIIMFYSGSGCLFSYLCYF